MSKVLKSKFPTHSLFKPGDLLIYYDFFQDHHKPIDQELFKRLSFETIKKLQPGDRLWVDMKIEKNGKIIGAKLIEVQEVTCEENLVTIRHENKISKINPNTCKYKVAILNGKKKTYKWTRHIYFIRNVR